MKKLATVLFSLAVGVVVIALAGAGSCTNRAGTADRAGPPVAPATQPVELERTLSSTKRGLVISGASVRETLESSPEKLLPGTKVAVFDTSKPVRVLLGDGEKPRFTQSPFAPTTQPATQPTARPATQPSGGDAPAD